MSQPGEDASLAADIEFLDEVRGRADAAARKERVPERLMVEAGDRVLEVGPEAAERRSDSGREHLR